jgi:Tfp pilus assembly protein FimT
VAFYIYAVLGVDLFSENDPVRFGSLPMAMLTLLQTATLSGWDDVLYTNQFGCDQHPGSLYNRTSVNGASAYVETPSGRFPGLVCTSPKAQPLLGALYFTSFTAVTAFFVLSLFVGIITLSMLEQMETHIRSKRMEARAQEFRNQLEVSVTHAIESREFLLQQLKHSSLGLKELPVAHLESKSERTRKAREKAARGKASSQKSAGAEESRQEMKIGDEVGKADDEDSDKEDTFVDIKFEVSLAAV